MMRNLGRMTMLALALCGVTRSSPAADSGADRTARSAERRSRPARSTWPCSWPTAASINSASYTITGPNGFTRTGTINVSRVDHADRHHRRPPRRDGLPDHHLRHDHRRRHAAAAARPRSACMAGQTVAVTVPLTCHEAPRTGSVMVSGKLNLCPTIDGIGANPAEVQVGGTIALSALAHDSDAGAEPR